MRKIVLAIFLSLTLTASSQARALDLEVRVALALAEATHASTTCDCSGPDDCTCGVDCTCLACTPARNSGRGESAPVTDLEPITEPVPANDSPQVSADREDADAWMLTAPKLQLSDGIYAKHPVTGIYHWCEQCNGGPQPTHRAPVFQPQRPVVAPGGGYPQPFRSAIDPHQCLACAQRGIRSFQYAILSENRNGSHNHRCGRCGFVWTH